MQKTAYDYEHSELLLYQNLVIQESGDVSAALAHLNQYKEQICDKATFMETKGMSDILSVFSNYIMDETKLNCVSGKLMLKSNKHSEAEAIFSELIRRNPEHHGYYKLVREILSHFNASN